MSDDFTNRLPIIPDRYANRGIYPASTINEIARNINNIRAGDGISIKRNVTSGYTISLEKPFHPFRVYGATNQGKEETDYPTVKVYKGSWTRNGYKIKFDTDTNKNYKTITIPDGDGKYVICSELSDSLNPVSMTTGYAAQDIYDEVLTKLDPANRYIKLATLNISNGNITGIIQNTFQDIDDSVTNLPFMIYDPKADYDPEAGFLNIKVRYGFWWQDNHIYGFYDSAAYQMLSISETGKIYIYVSFEDTYIEIIYTAGAPLAVDESKYRLIGALYIDVYNGYHRLNPNPLSPSKYYEGMLQLWTNDIHYGGGSSLPTPSNEYEVLTAVNNAGSLTWESGWVRFHA